MAQTIRKEVIFEYDNDCAFCNKCQTINIKDAVTGETIDFFTRCGFGTTKSGHFNKVNRKIFTKPEVKGGA